MSNVWTQTTVAGRQWRRKYQRENYFRSAVARRARSRLRYLNKRAWLLVDVARTRSKAKGYAFDLDGYREQIQARIDAGYCELSGIRFDLKGNRTFDSPSIDRIDPKRGYVYDNIRVVCNLMNVALGNWGEEPLCVIMEAYLALRKNRNNPPPVAAAPKVNSA